MAKTDVWMPVYIGDYLSDTMHLETEEHGAYFLLLLYGWRSDGKIPADDVTLAKLAKLPLNKWKKIRPTIAEFFDQVDGYWTQKRQIEELAKAGARRDSAKENGAKGGRPRNPEITDGFNLDNRPVSGTKPEANPGKSSLPSPLPSQEKLPPTPLEKRLRRCLDLYPKKREREGGEESVHVSKADKDRLGRMIAADPDYPFEFVIQQVAGKTKRPKNLKNFLDELPALESLADAMRAAVMRACDSIRGAHPDVEKSVQACEPFMDEETLMLLAAARKVRP